MKHYIPILYNIFVGFLVATFIGVGIAAFYQNPEQPSRYYSSQASKVATDAAVLSTYEEETDEWKAYEAELSIYNRNVAIYSLLGATIFLVVGLYMVKKVIFDDGLVLGGLFGLIYSIIMGFNSEDNIVRFIIVSASLIITAFVGQKKLFKQKK